jgi:dTDP-4-dehydrorhamnose 3,5-epimerase
MKFIETSLAGAFLIDIEPVVDERGFFARAWCWREFEQHGLNPDLKQCNISSSRKRGTIRGMHYQIAPYQEDKLVRVTQGAIYDIIIDLRPFSSTYKEWIGVELTADSYRMIYVPKGFAHGFQTLMDKTEVFYQMSEFFTPEYYTGFRWNDPIFNLRWPVEEKIISAKDQSFPNFARSNDMAAGGS